MKFRQWLEAQNVVDEDTKRAIYEKATTIGIPAKRGTVGHGYQSRVYASDPGDYGRGIYYTTTYSTALHGYGGGDPENVVQKRIKFKNPLVVSELESRELVKRYETVRQHVPEDVHQAIASDSPEKAKEWYKENPYGEKEQLENAERLTMDMIRKGHDGLIIIHHVSKKRRAIGWGQSHFEIVDYRPYM